MTTTRSRLATAVRQGGHPVTLGGIEFAREIVESLDCFRAGKNDKSLKSFLDDLRGDLRRMSRPDEEEHG